MMCSTRWTDESHMIQGSGLSDFMATWQDSIDKQWLLSKTMKRWPRRPRLLYPLLSHGIGDIHLFVLDKQGNVKAQKHSSKHMQTGTQEPKKRMKNPAVLKWFKAHEPPIWQKLSEESFYKQTIHFGSRRPSVRNNVSNKQASALFFQNAFTSWVHHASFLKLCFWSTAIAGHVSSPAQGAALSSKCLFSVFQFMKCSWLRGKNASGNNKVLMKNVKCIHVHGARVMYVRWGWVGKKNFWALCSTKMATCKPCV